MWNFQFQLTRRLVIGPPAPRSPFRNHRYFRIWVYWFFFQHWPLMGRSHKPKEGPMLPTLFACMFVILFAQMRSQRVPLQYPTIFWVIRSSHFQRYCVSTFKSLFFNRFPGGPFTSRLANCYTNEILHHEGPKFNVIWICNELNYFYRLFEYQSLCLS